MNIIKIYKKRYALIDELDIFCFWNSVDVIHMDFF